jgi:hypothetical protein
MPSARSSRQSKLEAINLEIAEACLSLLRKSYSPGTQPESDGGAGLDPQAAGVLRHIATWQLPRVDKVPIDELRELLMKELELAGPAEAVESVQEIALRGPRDDIPVRLYRSVGRPLGVLVLPSRRWVGAGNARSRRRPL